MLQNTSQKHKAQTPPAKQEPNITPHTTNQQQVIITELNLPNNRPPPLFTIHTQHITTTHPAPTPTNSHNPPSPQYLTTDHTTVPLYSNPPASNSIPYSTSPSTPPQSHHPLHASIDV